MFSIFDNITKTHTTSVQKIAISEAVIIKRPKTINNVVKKETSMLNRGELNLPNVHDSGPKLTWGVLFIF